MSKTKQDSNFDSYKKYYPDKWAAIGALRQETGMGFTDANDVINQLFGMTDDDERIKDDAEQEIIYQAQLEAEKNTNKQGVFSRIAALFGFGKKGN